MQLFADAEMVTVARFLDTVTSITAAQRDEEFALPDERRSPPARREHTSP